MKHEEFEQRLEGHLTQAPFRTIVIELENGDSFVIENSKHFGYRSGTAVYLGKGRFHSFRYEELKSITSRIP